MPWSSAAPTTPSFVTPFGEALPTGTALIDGNAGITAQLRRRLSELGLLNPGPEPGRVDFYNSLEDPEILRRSRFLLELPDDE